MFSHFLLVTLQLALAYAITVDDCPIDLTRDEYLKVHGNKCYRFEVNSYDEFPGAESSCKQNGGNLAFVKSKDVNDFIQNTLKSFGLQSDQFWIGLRYNSHKHKFYWLDNTPLLGYSNFQTQPKHKKCVGIVAASGYWKNHNCQDNSLMGIHDYSKRFICEYKSIPNDCPSNVKSDKYLRSYGNNCYRFELKLRKDFQSAQKYCDKNGGNLALVKSNEINNFIKNELNYFRFHNAHVWIGLHYNSIHNAFYWVDGTQLTGFSNFPSDSPYSSNECVALLAKSGLWRGYKCKSGWFVKQRNHFVCEYPKSKPTILVPTTKPSSQPTFTIDSCPPNLERNTYLKVYRNKCYQFEVNQLEDFQNAQDYCQQEGGNLAMVKSRDMNNFLWNEINTMSGDSGTYYWIGLRHDSFHRRMHWVDGAVLGYSNYRSNVYHTTNECAAISSEDGVWDAMKCESSDYMYDASENKFICEFNVVQPTTMSQNATPVTTTFSSDMSDGITVPPIPHNSSITKDDCPVKVSHDKYLQVFDDKCYYFDFKDTLSFQNAETFCKNYGGTLALIKSKNINDFIFHHLSITHKLDFSSSDLWIGLSYSPQHKSYTWTDESPLKFTNFEMEDARLGECASIVPWDGQWTDTGCSVKQHFICEFVAKRSPPLSTKTPNTTSQFRNATTPITTIQSQITTTLATTKQLQTTMMVTPNTTIIARTNPTTTTTQPTTDTNSTTTNAYTSTTKAQADNTTTIINIATTTKPTITNTSTITTKASTNVTAQPSTTLKPMTTTNTGCPSLICDLDCGLSGYLTDPLTGCMKCQCDE